LNNKTIVVYTDGSCHTQLKIGGWAALIFYNNEKIVLQGSDKNTTHNRMELLAVINSIKYIIKELSDFKNINIYTDSQYVERIPLRIKKFVSKDFKTKSGKEIQNIDLVKELIQLIDTTQIDFIKVKAHQKSTSLPNFNREVDMLSRKIVRNKLKKT